MGLTYTEEKNRCKRKRFKSDQQRQRKEQSRESKREIIYNLLLYPDATSTSLRTMVLGLIPTFLVVLWVL